MRMLYGGRLEGTARHRLDALRRLGHEVVDFDFAPYAEAGSRLQRSIRLRLLAGRTVARLNAALLAAADRHRPDLVWLDKALWVQPGTVAALRARSTVVHYSSDLPSGVRGDPGWRLLRRAVPHYTAVVAPSEGHRDEYARLGARRFVRMPFGHEPAVHCPPPADWRDADRVHDVSYIGTPYEDRPAFLLALARDHGIRVKVSGDLWARHLTAGEQDLLQLSPGCHGDSYREAIWRARICLGFVTHAMRHDSARRWAEIPACGGFLLAESTPAFADWYDPGREADAFSSVADCADRIRHYLARPELRGAIAAAGHARAWGHYANEQRLAACLESLATQAPPMG